MNRFTHDDTQERDLPQRVPAKYALVHYDHCEVRVTRVHSAVSHRTMLCRAGEVVDDDRFFALGIEGDDVDCAHEVEVDRMGYGICTKCEGHLWCAGWVADGWQGDGTVAWANDLAACFAERLPKLRVIMGGRAQR